LFLPILSSTAAQQTFFSVYNDKQIEAPPFSPNTQDGKTQIQLEKKIFDFRRTVNKLSH
jgi:hypothetical protein